MKQALVLFALLGAISAASAQDAPKLKPEIALAIKDQQIKLLEAQANEGSILQQYQTLEKQKSDAIAQMQALEKTALKDSGIDEAKFLLNPETLEVTAKPAEPKAPAKK